MEVIEYPQIMGIININEESFYQDSRCTGADAFYERFTNMINNGANIIDLGACSTRPGSIPVSMEQEWEYLKEPLLKLKKMGRGNCDISIDTFRAEIVRRAYDVIGSFIVNDISAGEDDEQMLKLVGDMGLKYVAMHKRGLPSTMGQMCDYADGVTNEVIKYFKEFDIKAKAFGIKDYIIDPGLGFAKTIEQNYTLLKDNKRIKEELKLVNPKTKILIGLSRKGMMWRLFNITPKETLPATTALNLFALINGADIIRVHDVPEAVQCLKMWELLR